MSALTTIKRSACYDDSLPSSDSDDYHRVFYSSSSHDRSSVGSIPWAEDAIKQNQQEWQRIERMFYGEEELTENDQDLKREIIEWTTAFPHIRVVGRQLKLEEAPTTESYNYEASFEKGFTDNQDNLDKSFMVHPEARSILYDVDLSRLLDRDLRIHSVPMVSKRSQFTDLDALPPDNSVWSKSVSRSLLLQPSIQSGRVVRRQVFPSDSSNALPTTSFSFASKPKPNLTTSKSARIVRMPPIVNFILPPSSNKYLPTDSIATHFLFSGKKPNGTRKAQAATATTRLNHEPIVLPVIKLESRNLFRGDVGDSRSISAAVNERKLRAMYLTNSASKLKIWK